MPFVPVMQIIFAFVKRAANSISDMTLIFLSFNPTIIEALSGIPGLLTTSLAAKIISCECCPSSKRIFLSVSSFLYFAEIAPKSETKTS